MELGMVITLDYMYFLLHKGYQTGSQLSLALFNICIDDQYVNLVGSVMGLHVV